MTMNHGYQICFLGSCYRRGPYNQSTAFKTLKFYKLGVFYIRFFLCDFFYVFFGASCQSDGSSQFQLMLTDFSYVVLLHHGPRKRGDWPFTNNLTRQFFMRLLQVMSMLSSGCYWLLSVIFLLLLFVLIMNMFVSLNFV